MSMVDITPKPDTYREAEAVGVIRLRRQTIDMIRRGEIRKGDVVEAAKIAAALAAKMTPHLIPLTHPIPLTGVEVSVEIRDTSIEVRTRVRTTYKTGVEIEALVAAATALITIWDTVKEYEKAEDGQYPETSIESVRVVKKFKEDHSTK